MVNELDIKVDLRVEASVNIKIFIGDENIAQFYDVDIDDVSNIGDQITAMCLGLTGQ